MEGRDKEKLRILVRKKRKKNWKESLIYDFSRIVSYANVVDRYLDDGPRNFIRWRRFRNRHICWGNREAITNRSCLARGFRPHLGQRTNLGNLFANGIHSLGNFDVRAWMGFLDVWMWIVWTLVIFRLYQKRVSEEFFFKYLVEEYGLSLRKDYFQQVIF